MTPGDRVRVRTVGSLDGSSGVIVRWFTDSHKTAVVMCDDAVIRLFPVTVLEVTT